jgi:hypothetical protein
LLEPLNVGEILQAPYGAFVLDQLPATENRDGHTAEGHGSLLGPAVRECHSVNAAEDIDSARRHTDLEDRVRRGEIDVGEMLARRSERLEGIDNPRGMAASGSIQMSRSLVKRGAPCAASA